MLDPNQVPPVGPDERLARFVLFSKHFRSADHTVKSDAFIPHPNVDLSMTRHLQATAEELWGEGQRIAAARRATLYGRADVGGSAFIAQGLLVVAAPILENPNHVNAVNWPEDKPAQKIKAIEIAERATYLPKLN